MPWRAPLAQPVSEISTSTGITRWIIHYALSIFVPFADMLAAKPMAQWNWHINIMASQNSHRYSVRGADACLKAPSTTSLKRINSSFQQGMESWNTMEKQEGTLLGAPGLSKDATRNKGHEATRIKAGKVLQKIPYPADPGRRRRNT